MLLFVLYMLIQQYWMHLIYDLYCNERCYAQLMQRHTYQSIIGLWHYFLMCQDFKYWHKFYSCVTRCVGMVPYSSARVCVVVASLPTRNCTTQHRIQFDWLLVEEKTRNLGHYCNRSILHSFFIRHVTTQISYQAHIKQHDGRIATDCLCLID